MGCSAVLLLVSSFVKPAAVFCGFLYGHALCYSEPFTCLPGTSVAVLLD